MWRATFCTLIFWAASLSHAQTIHVDELFARQKSLSMKVQAAGQATITREGDRWRIRGKAPFWIAFSPAKGDVWDISDYRLIALDVLNKSSGLTTIEGRLKNSKPTGWSRHAVGFAVAPPGESTTLGFPYPIPEDRYAGPAVFGHQLARPNGHRLHWRQFFPEDVRVITLAFESSTERVDLLVSDLYLTWPHKPELENQLNALPFLDTMGQVRNVDWPGKAKDIRSAGKLLHQELVQAKEAAQSRRLSKYGGWLDGPKREASGHFRTEKIDGQWWLIDPEGHLFFSVGACLAGHTAATALLPARREAGYFEYIPDSKDYLRWIGLRKNNERETINYPAMNYARMYGDQWKTINRNGIHNRMRSWGVNTLGCWSDLDLQKDQRTPYTLIASIWWQPSGHKKFPSPFRKNFESDLRKALKKYTWAKNDPFCLGIFLGNELEWPDQISPHLFRIEKDHPTKIWARNRLKEKYQTLQALNTAWKTTYNRWEEVLTHNPQTIPSFIKQDLEPLYLELTTEFFRTCKAAIEAELPGKLYLGCRTHRGPNVLGRGASGHVDVFSVNVYDSRVRSWQVPPEMDLPIISSEFHFGAVDRGVPSPGLSAAWNQRQRALSFAHYLASALADSRFVGVHWFQWQDQSAAGRPDRENHQVGFVDVTGRAYPEFVDVVSQVTEQMYGVRQSKPGATVDVLDALLKSEVPTN